MAHKMIRKQYIAYLKDGTQVTFNHPIDYFNGLKAGMLPNPPGVTVATEQVVIPEGEKVLGIMPIISEKKEQPVTEHIDEGKSKKTKLHR